MEASEIQDVCRLCPETGSTETPLLNIFNRKNPDKNMKEVIFVTTGIEVMENDLVTRKICQRCWNITLKMQKFRQDAIKQDKTLKEKCNQILISKGFILPKTPVQVKQEPEVPKLKSETKPDPTQKKQHLHSSVQHLYKTHPGLKLPRVCTETNVLPVVSLPIGHVEHYFKARSLNMTKFIARGRGHPSFSETAQNKVAKKSTSMVAKKKVTPIKISRTLLPPKGGSDEGYIYRSSIKMSPIKVSTRKRLISTSESEDDAKKPKVKKPENLSDPSLLKTILERTPTQAVDSKSSREKASSQISESVTVPQETRRVPTPSYLPSDDCGSTTPKPIIPDKDPLQITPLSSGNSDDSRSEAPEHFSENSRHSEDSDYSAGTLCGSGDESEDSLKLAILTPRVKTVKTQKLSNCNICGNVLRNAFELKRHLLKHAVCQFCKRSFKSVEAKKTHVENFCEVKIIMNRNVSVSLKRVESILEMRKMYPRAFVDFEAIPGSVEPVPVEEVIIPAVSPLPVGGNNIIVLSDDEDESESRQKKDPFSGIPTPSTVQMPLAGFSSVSLVKPDVRIKFSDILDKIPANSSEKSFMKQLVKSISPKPATATKMTNSEMPASKDICINAKEGICEFKNLKRNLSAYKIPVNIKNGVFHIGYKFKKDECPTKNNTRWESVSLVDGSTAPVPSGGQVLNSVVLLPAQVSTSPANGFRNDAGVCHTLNIYPVQKQVKNQPLGGSAVQSNQVPVSKQHHSPQRPISNRNSFPLNSQSIARNIVQQASVNQLAVTASAMISASVVSSATPLLQNYAQNLVLTIPSNKPAPFPRAYVNAALNNRSQAALKNKSNVKPPPNNATDAPKAGIPPLLVTINPVNRPSPPYSNSSKPLGAPTVATSSTRSNNFPTNFSELNNTNTPQVVANSVITSAANAAIASGSSSEVRSTPPPPPPPSELNNTNTPQVVANSVITSAANTAVASGNSSEVRSTPPPPPPPAIGPIGGRQNDLKFRVKSIQELL